MKHISILVPQGQYSIVNIAGTLQILEWANEVYLQQSRKKLFEIELVGSTDPARDQQGIYTVHPSRTIEQVAQTDLIIIPAVHGDLPEAIKRNQALIRWVNGQYDRGAEIAAFCIGVFLLADSGMLDGKACSTHWAYAAELQAMFPGVLVRPEKIVTESSGIYCSGGAYAFTNLVIYLIEKFGGRELAIMTAKAFMVDVDKHNQSVFMIFNGQKDHQDEMVLSVQEYLEQNYDDKLNVNQIANKYATVRRTLERRFKNATGNSVLEYLQRVRMEAAKRVLEKDKATVKEAMYQVGYSDSKSFRDVFRKYVGLTPSDYQRKYMRVAD